MTNHLELLIQVGEPRLSDGEFLPIKNFSTEVALIIGEGDKHINAAVKNLQAMVSSLFPSLLMPKSCSEIWRNVSVRGHVVPRGPGLVCREPRKRRVTFGGEYRKGCKFFKHTAKIMEPTNSRRTISDLAWKRTTEYGDQFNPRNAEQYCWTSGQQEGYLPSPKEKPGNVRDSVWLYRVLSDIPSDTRLNT